MERATVDVYEREAATYAGSASTEAPRPGGPVRRGGCRSDRPVLDVGCGPGGYLPDLLASGAPVVALDAARAMLDLAHDTAPMALRLRADIVALPFRPFSLGAAWARNTYLHVRRAHLPARARAPAPLARPRGTGRVQRRGRRRRGPRPR